MRINRISMMAVIAISVSLYSCTGKSHSSDDGHGHDSEAQESEETHKGDEIIFSTAQAQAAGLTLETVEPAPFAEVIRTSGQILSAQGDEVTLVATSNGIISYSDLTLTDGSPVQQGQTLFTISAKNVIEGDPITKARIEFETAQEEYERAESLAKDKIVSAKELSQAKLRYQTAKATYDGVSDKADSNGVAIAATMSGFVKNRLVRQGEYVSVGQPVAVISQNRRLVLRAEVSERYFNQLSSIESANFKMPYSKNEVFKLSNLNGRLLSFGKALADDSFYLPITFEFDNIGHHIVPGSYAEIYLLGNTRSQVLSLPETALTEEQGVYYVYIQLDEEGYRKQEVGIGASNGERVEILSGLQVGEIVVTRGALQVKMASASVAPTGHSH